MSGLSPSFIENLEASAIFWFLDLVIIVMLLPSILQAHENRRWKPMRMHVVSAAFTYLFSMKEAFVRRVEALLTDEETSPQKLDDKAAAEMERCFVEFRTTVDVCQSCITPQMSQAIVGLFNSHGSLRDSCLNAVRKPHLASHVDDGFRRALADCLNFPDWRPLTYSEFREAVDRLGAGLEALEARHSEGRPDFPRYRRISDELGFGLRWENQLTNVQPKWRRRLHARRRPGSLRDRLSMAISIFFDDLRDAWDRAFGGGNTDRDIGQARAMAGFESVARRRREERRQKIMGKLPPLASNATRRP